MRILIATQNLNLVGGVETYLRAVLPMLQRRGLEVGVVTAHPATANLQTILDRCPDVPAWTAAAPDEVVAVATGFRPDVVFTHDLTNPSADDELAQRFPVVRFVHNYAGTCVSGTKCHAKPTWQVCSRRLGLACLALYLPRRCGGGNPLTALRLYRENRRRQHTLGRVRSVLVASQHMADEVIRNGAPAERVSVAPLFPPDMDPDPNPPEPKPRTDRVLFVGRQTAIKGLRELGEVVQLSSATLGRKLTLVVAGDGPDQANCETAFRLRAVPAEFLGRVDRTGVIALMRSADVLVVPSVWPEPFGLVGIEAGCVGLPAVAFATGGIPEWLTPGVSGESAPGNRPRAAELADALVRAIADPNHWQRLRVGAWETAKRFTPEHHLNRLISVLETGTRP